MPIKKDKLRSGVLGGSINSAVGSAHIAALNLSLEYDVVAGCFSLDRERNSTSAAAYSLSPEKTYRSLEDMLAKERLDVVHILTPTTDHLDHIVACIRAGVPTISEKAVATSAMEAKIISAELEAHKGFLGVIYNYLGYPALRELKYMIRNKVLGDIHKIHIEMPQETFLRVDKDGNPTKPQSWRLKDSFIPTVSLDLGVHVHILVRYLTEQRAVSLIAESNSFGNFKGVIDDVTCLVRYDGGMSCNIWYSKCALGNRNGLNLRVYGDKGAVRWVQEDPEVLHLADNHGRRSIIDRATNGVSVCNQPRYCRFKAGHPAGFIEAFANYYDDLAEAIREHKKGNSAYISEHSYGIQEALEGLKLFEAASRSSKSGRWENIGDL